MKRSLAGLALAIALVLGGTAAAQVPPPPPGAAPPPPATAAPLYAAAQLDQMLAAIALYPDPLLTAMLTAATYPLEVVDADRWLGAPGNAALNDGALANALVAQSWDPSVKSLVPFPPVLRLMDTHLDWTQALGNAFLAQPADVMDSIQRLRHDAMSSGALVSTPQATVVVNGPYIEIEPANPQYVYIPVYNPTTAYGSWPYPADLPTYYGPPPGLSVSIAGAGISFGVGIGVVDALWNWGTWDWQHHDVRVDPSRFNRIDPRQAPVTATVWQHAPAHRRGVPYVGAAAQARYQRKLPGSPSARAGFRGYPPQAQRAALPPSAAPQRANEARPQTPSRPPAAQAGRPPAAPQAQRREPAAQAQPRPAPRAQPRPEPPAQARPAPQAQRRPAPQAQPRPAAPQRPATAFARPAPGPEAQAMSRRGQQSRQAMAPARAAPQRAPQARPQAQSRPQARPQPQRQEERRP